METIALAVPVVVGLEVAAALGLAWLCWRLAARRDLLALRDIARAFVALGIAALVQLFDDSGSRVNVIAAREFVRSLSVWLYLGFMILGAAQLASNNFVTDRVRRDVVLGSIISAMLSSGISMIAVGDPVMQDMIANALRAGGTGVACLIIARVISRAPQPPKMLLGASVVRVALSLVTILAAVRAGVAMFHSFSQFARAVQWQPLLTVEFLAHCGLGLGLVIWILDRDWALADASMESAEHRAASDALTGLPNRTIVLDRLEMAVASARRSATLVGTLFIDLDEFKAVNDRYGHAAGDAVLRAVGARLQHLLRASDTVGRIGGDEFVAISPFLRSGRRSRRRGAEGARGASDGGAARRGVDQRGRQRGGRALSARCRHAERAPRGVGRQPVSRQGCPAEPATAAGAGPDGVTGALPSGAQHLACWHTEQHDTGASARGPFRSRSCP